MDHKTKTIWLCRDFVERIYAKTDDWRAHKENPKDEEKTIKLKEPTLKFDKCGFQFNEKIYAKDERNNDIEQETENSLIQYPSRRYKNAFALIDDPDLKPAFFKDYIFRIDGINEAERLMKEGDDGLMEQNTPPSCFN